MGQSHWRTHHPESSHTKAICEAIVTVLNYVGNARSSSQPQPDMRHPPRTFNYGRPHTTHQQVFADSWSSGPDLGTGSSFFSREKTQKTQKQVEGGTKGRKLVGGRIRSAVSYAGLDFCASCAFSRPTGNYSPQESAALRIAGAVNMNCGPVPSFLAAKKRRRRKRM